MKINVVLSYQEAGKYYKKWADEEEKIDFKSDLFSATRTTVSFAAKELCEYLSKLGHDVCVLSERADGLNVLLSSDTAEGEEFDIKNVGEDIVLYGYGRRGALYAVYELLEIQGVRWYSPDFEFVPTDKEFKIPKSKHYKYDLAEGRGFHFEDLQNESKSFILWMARNRMNTHACHSHLKAFQEKLGMIFASGGHIFEKILNPYNIAEDGRYFIDAHRDFYGVREDGELTADNALKTQFCVSNGELLDYLSKTVIEKLNSVWKNENVISLDGFDTWGKSCGCKKCKSLGNGSDVSLKFMSHIRARINEAQERGELRQGIKLSFCAYEGTATMHAPENPVPQNLIDAGDYVLFAPIMRCYAHDFYEPCDRNKGYNDDFLAWRKTGIKMAFLEYYNVSKFEDLPLLFTKRIANDIKYYVENGISACVYMHVFLKEWGVRALNHYLYGVVMRDRGADCDAIISEYFENVYGEWASDAKRAYEKIERATALISSFRAWNFHSILTSLMEWDGKEPKGALDYDTHVIGKAVEEGKRSVRLLSSALFTMRKIRENALLKIKPDSFAVTLNAVNPDELSKIKSGAAFIDKLNEDIRGLSYGLDVYKMMTLFIEYYECRLAGGDGASILSKIKPLGIKMSEYTYSVVFKAYEAEFELRDALKRSQLKELYYRCIALENEKNKK